MDYSKEFRKFATKDRGISSLHLDEFTSIHGNYISPTIIEERQMNVASMDVFSRLMMDRIIFLGVPINDYVANIIKPNYYFRIGRFKKGYINYKFTRRRGLCRQRYTILCNILIKYFTICTEWQLQWGAVLLCWC